MVFACRREGSLVLVYHAVEYADCRRGCRRLRLLPASLTRPSYFRHRMPQRPGDLVPQVLDIVGEHHHAVELLDRVAEDVAAMPRITSKARLRLSSTTGLPLGPPPAATQAAIEARARPASPAARRRHRPVAAMRREPRLGVGDPLDRHARPAPAAAWNSVVGDHQHFAARGARAGDQRHRQASALGEADDPRARAGRDSCRPAT